MSVFTDAEIAYLAEQRLGRLGTVGRDGMPHLSPVGFRYNREEDAIDIGGMRMTMTKKYRDVVATGRAALVVDDVLPPWKPRGIEIRGVAVALPDGGRAINAGFEPGIVRIRPTRIVGWGLDPGTGWLNARSV